ncbi:ATP-binding protein [Candidatus Pacearchaeota archaeon]|nr:ATP-binding protein [Candidatus Pacearchaeota archaeon]
MYEIPQQLEYKEIIVFGLDFKQLVWAFLFFPISLFIIFSFHFNLYIRIFLALIPALIGIGFIFFNFLEHLKNWISWYRFRHINKQKDIQNLIRLDNIEKEVIYSNKKKLAVLKVESLNFQIKPTNEQEAITLSFQKFLNSLDFPLQILITTEELSLESYLDNLKENINQSEENMAIYEEYKTHLVELISKNKVLNRNFYVVIQETTNIENQVKICEERLNSLHLKTKRLNKNDFDSLFRQIFYAGNNISILPREIKNNIDHLEIDGKFYRTIYAHGYPRKVETGFLDRLISFSGNFNISIQIETSNIETTMVNLNKELQKQRADLYSAKIKNQLNPSLEIKYRDTLGILENLQKGEERLFNVSLFINCQAPSKKELDLLTKTVESELNSMLIIPRQPLFRMVQGYKSCLPFIDNSLNVKRNIPTSALSAFFPFTTQFFKFDPTGIWLGLGKSNIPIIRDIFKLSNANGVCLASSGSGKSYLAKLLISRHLLSGTKVIIIDPQGEYAGLVEKFQGQRIDLARDSDTIINPLDLMGHTYPEKRLALMELMPIMLGDLSEPQKTFLDKALTDAYEKKGIIMNNPRTWEYAPPRMQDVLKRLIIMEKRATSLEKISIRSLINRMNIYVKGVFSFLDQHTNINFDNDFICFDIGKLPRQIKPTMMFLVLDYVYTKMKRDLKRKILVIDEAWALLSRSQDSSYLFEIVKTCRKFNMGLFLINQEVEDMLNSKAGRSVLANSSYTLLLRQKPAVIESIQKIFHLSGSERVLLLTAMVGEGLLIMEDDHSKIKIVASEKEHEIITTNADEILLKNNKKPIEQKPIKQEQKEINITLNEERGIFRMSKLSTEDIIYLESKGYKQFEAKSFKTKKLQRYMVFPRSNESLPHAFMCYQLYYFIKKFTDKVKMYETIKPDIIFEVKGQKYAIEVETGKTLETNRKALMEKVKNNNKLYGKNWFFVMTNKKIGPSYSNLAETTDNRYIQNKIEKLFLNS